MSDNKPNSWGCKVSTRKQSNDCMRRILVGLLKKPVKTINAEKESVKATRHVLPTGNYSLAVAAA